MTNFDKQREVMEKQYGNAVYPAVAGAESKLSLKQDGVIGSSSMQTFPACAEYREKTAPVCPLSVDPECRRNHRATVPHAKTDQEYKIRTPELPESDDWQPFCSKIVTVRLFQ